MCGRMTLTQPDLGRAAGELGATVSQPELYRPRYNVAPTDQHWIVVAGPEGRRIVPARWSFGPRSLINARSEALANAKRGAFKEALEKHRCIVIADGFFEWTGARDARRPIWYHRKDGGLLWIAGVWEPQAEGKPGFVVLTTDANDLVARVHDRMPVILDADRVARWLEKAAPEVLAPAPDDLLVAQPVSPRANSVKNDDPACLDAPPEDAPRPAKPSQLRLV